MAHQRPHYLKLKGATYYYSRRVPKELQSYASTTRFETCLHTRCKTQAYHQASLLNQEIEDQWSILRRRSRNERIGRLFGTTVATTKAPTGSQAIAGPKITEALELYLKLKGINRSATFEAGARRSISYLLEVTEDKPITGLERKDANALRDYLQSRGLSKDSINRNFTNVRAIVNFILREEGLPVTGVFSGVYLGEAALPKKRYVPTKEELKRIQQQCQRMDDEPRWLIALILDTGMRLSEAVGLTKDDINLKADIPHVLVRPNRLRRLKTQSSEREVPLAGFSLWAAQRAIMSSTGGNVFPRYTSNQEAQSNSASAALGSGLITKT